MTRQDAKALLSYATALYPGLWMTSQQADVFCGVWASEFSEYSAESVIEAFKSASRLSPDRFPSAPKVHEVLESSGMATMNPEQEYRNMHGGKSKTEWEAMVKWQESAEGKAKLAEFRERVNRIFSKTV